MSQPSATNSLLPPAVRSQVFKPATVKSYADKFRDVLKESEKLTVIFNLDMGNFPLMNPNTISKKATLALSKMAAKVEEKNDSIPSKDAVSAIDDLLSITKNMSFFGGSTKPYNNPHDENHGRFYTVPVKYDFKDRDTRATAEKILRSRCNVSCTTPYPVMLRECIRQTNEPESFFRTSIDIPSLSLHVSKKINKDSKWERLNTSFPIPEAAMNNTARFVPKNFKMTGLDLYHEEMQSRRHPPLGCHGRTFLL
jgi:hypothetical protein